LTVIDATGNPTKEVSVPDNGYPRLRLLVAAVLGAIIGFGLWTLVEGGSTQAPHAGATTTVKGHGATHGLTRRARSTPVARPTPSASPENHIEVLRE
jgi:hypothetical protein